MDNLNFGISGGLLLIAAFALMYLLIAACFYCLTAIVGGLVLRLADRLVPAKTPRHILYLAGIYLAAALLIVWVVSTLAAVNIGASGGAAELRQQLVARPYRFYSYGFITDVVRLVCLALTRYAYSGTWQVQGRLRPGASAGNFFLWTVFFLALAFVPFLRSAWLLLPILAVVMTCFFLVWRRRDKRIR